MVMDGDFTILLFHCFILLLFYCFTVGGDLAVPANGVVGGNGKDEETLDERGNCFEI